jgi:hypothetical protein
MCPTTRRKGANVIFDLMQAPFKLIKSLVGDSRGGDAVVGRMSGRTSEKKETPVSASVSSTTGCRLPN